jgi:hypothetical protein
MRRDEHQFEKHEYDVRSGGVGGRTGRGSDHMTCAIGRFSGHPVRHQREDRATDIGARLSGMTRDTYAGLFADDVDSVAERLDSLVPQMRHTADDTVVNFAESKARKFI